MDKRDVAQVVGITVLVVVAVCLVILAMPPLFYYFDKWASYWIQR